MLHRNASRHLAALSLVALLVVGCSAGDRSASRSDGGDVITRETIDASRTSYSNAYQIVERLRPQWLRKRSGGGSNEMGMNQEMEGDIVVYVDGTRIGGPQALRGIMADGVASIRFLNAAEATRYGTGHQHGAILVVTRSR